MRSRAMLSGWLAQAARLRPSTPVLGLLLIAEKLGLSGSVESDFDQGHTGAFGDRQNYRRDKPVRETDFAKHADRPRPKFKCMRRMFVHKYFGPRWEQPRLDR